MKKLIFSGAAALGLLFCATNLMAQETPAPKAEVKSISAIVTLKKTDGTPLSGEELTIIQFDRKARKEINLFTG